MTGCVVFLGGYVAIAIIARVRLGSRFWLFAAGTLTLLLAFVSPLDQLGDEYLFSAHMLQHLLLLLVAPPLWLVGLPPELAEAILSFKILGRIERLLRRPVLAWSVGTVTIWVWHLPALYNATLASETVHIFEHLCFLASAVIFWWPVLSPFPGSRLGALMAATYLFLAAAAGSGLGILETFAGPGFYPAYLHPQDTLGILSIVRDQWGLTPAADQQFGGMMMWVIGTLAYLAALIRWFDQGDEEGVENFFEGESSESRVESRWE